MAEKSRSDIIGDIEDHVESISKGKFNKWCVGTSLHPKRDMTQKHKVTEGKNPFIVRRAKDPDQASEIVTFLSDVRGMERAAPNDGAERAVHVYAYERARRTKP